MGEASGQPAVLPTVSSRIVTSITTASWIPELMESAVTRHAAQAVFIVSADDPNPAPRRIQQHVCDRGDLPGMKFLQWAAVAAQARADHPATRIQFGGLARLVERTVLLPSTGLLLMMMMNKAKDMPTSACCRPDVMADVKSHEES